MLVPPRTAGMITEISSTITAITLPITISPPDTITIRAIRSASLTRASLDGFVSIGMLRRTRDRKERPVRRMSMADGPLRPIGGNRRMGRRVERVSQRNRLLDLLQIAPSGHFQPARGRNRPSTTISWPCFERTNLMNSATSGGSGSLGFLFT